MSKRQVHGRCTADKANDAAGRLAAGGPSPSRAWRDAFWLGLIVITAAGAYLRATHLAHPMRYDECYTFLLYIDSADPGSLFKYDAPNNHVLHTLAVFVSSRLLGDDPWALRMPAFLAGVAIIPLGGLLARRLAASVSGGLLAGLLAATLLASSSILVEYSVNARGYSMLCLATLVQAMCTVSLCRDAGRRRAWIGWTLAGALGLYTMPTMVYAIAICAVVIVAQAAVGPDRRRTLARLAWRLPLFALLTAGLAALAYWPVFALNGVSAVVANEYTRAKPWADAASHNWAAMREAAGHWLRDTSWPWRVAVGAGAAAAVAAAIRRREMFWALPVLGPALLAAMLLGQRVTPFARTWLFLLPVVLACAAAGLEWIARSVRPWKLAWLAPAAAAALVGAGAWSSGVRTADREYLISEDPRTMVDAEAICRDVAQAGGNHPFIAAWTPGWPSLAYYWRLAHGRPLVVSKQTDQIYATVSEGQTLDEVVEHFTWASEFRPYFQPWKTYPHATVYRVVQPASMPATTSAPVATAPGG